MSRIHIPAHLLSTRDPEIRQVIGCIEAMDSEIEKLNTEISTLHSMISCLKGDVHYIETTLGTVKNFVDKLKYLEDVIEDGSRENL